MTEHELWMDTSVLLRKAAEACPDPDLKEEIEGLARRALVRRHTASTSQDSQD